MFGDRINMINFVKERAKEIFTGTTVSLDPEKKSLVRHEIWHVGFLSPDVEDLLPQHVKDDNSSLLVFDLMQERLLLYADDDRLNESYPPIIADVVAKLDAMQPARTIALSASTWAAVQAHDLRKAAQAVLGRGNFVLDEASTALIVRCPPRTEQLLQHELSSPHPSISRAQAHFRCHACGKVARGVILTFCEHVVCFSCFDKRMWHVLADPLGKHFPLRCGIASCGERIAVSDIRKLVSAERLQALFELSVDQHTLSLPETYRSCREKKCQSVYLVTETAALYTCVLCFTQTCTYKHCGKAPHVGWDCKLEKSMNVVMKCPVCKANVINPEARTHIRCHKCLQHICCECVTRFESLEEYVEHQYLAGCKQGP
ncbi:hypothetical protein C7974DRAFT_202969 [Boeremia exigua]|uniref:uncharacterized protein n=1 Tax=Boeremia exigua TaxID=749465 RepID=UPI001E8EC2EF|nr:uncharacterized protein C7974DRAFT_202969 [Boeremia exigua]KAH6625568.1 hypothetical protein C7974DRAFT_202969 [Boeremia exigua]